MALGIQTAGGIGPGSGAPQPKGGRLQEQILSRIRKGIEHPATADSAIRAQSQDFLESGPFNFGIAGNLANALENVVKSAEAPSSPTEPAPTPSPAPAPGVSPTPGGGGGGGGAPPGGAVEALQPGGGGGGQEMPTSQFQVGALSALRSTLGRRNPPISTRVLQGRLF